MLVDERGRRIKSEPRYWVTLDEDRRPIRLDPAEPRGPEGSIEITRDQWRECLDNQNRCRFPENWDKDTSQIERVEKRVKVVPVTRKYILATVASYLRRTDHIQPRHVEQLQMVEDGAMSSRDLRYTDDQMKAWRRWRQELRDLDTSGDPETITVPEPPFPLERT